MGYDPKGSGVEPVCGWGHSPTRKNQMDLGPSMSDRVPEDHTERSKVLMQRKHMGEAIRPASCYGPAAGAVVWGLGGRARSVLVF